MLARDHTVLSVIHTFNPQVPLLPIHAALLCSVPILLMVGGTVGPGGYLHIKMM